MRPSEEHMCCRPRPSSWSVSGTSLQWQRGVTVTTIPGGFLIRQPYSEPSHTADKGQRITAFTFKVWGQREGEWDKTEEMTPSQEKECLVGNLIKTF